MCGAKRAFQQYTRTDLSRARSNKFRHRIVREQTLPRLALHRALLRGRLAQRLDGRAQLRYRVDYQPDVRLRLREQRQHERRDGDVDDRRLVCASLKRIKKERRHIVRARACRRAKKNKIDRGSARIKRAIAAAERTVKRRRVQILAEAEVGRLLGGLRERGAHPLDLEERVVGGVARAQQYCALGVGEYAELQRQRRERVLYRGRHVTAPAL